MCDIKNTKAEVLVPVPVLLHIQIKHYTLSLSGCVVCTCFGVVIKVLLHSNSDAKRMEDQFTDSHPRRIAKFALFGHNIRFADSLAEQKIHHFLFGYREHKSFHWNTLVESFVFAHIQLHR